MLLDNKGVTLPARKVPIKVPAHGAYFTQSACNSQQTVLSDRRAAIERRRRSQSRKRGHHPVNCRLLLRTPGNGQAPGGTRSGGRARRKNFGSPPRKGHRGEHCRQWEIFRTGKLAHGQRCAGSETANRSCWWTPPVAAMCRRLINFWPKARSRTSRIH